jgi:hypothetical protein
LLLKNASIKCASASQARKIGTNAFIWLVEESVPDRWLGVTVSSDKVIIVDAEVPAAGPLVIQADHSWSLQQGDRAIAYHVMQQHIADYARENNVVKAIIKGSAVSLGGTKKAHLEAAELRGVVMCALASVTITELESKARISKTFGARKVDEYLKDHGFWGKEVTGNKLRVGSREAAMVLLAGRAR